VQSASSLADPSTVANSGVDSEEVVSNRIESPSTPSLRRRIEDSQTTPKITSDFERVFSKVIGTAPASKPAEYSVIYKRAFGGATGEKDIDLSNEEGSSVSRSVVEAKQDPGPSAAEKSGARVLSHNYTAVFSRLARNEDANGPEIRESLKRCMESTEEARITLEVSTPLSKSVFERLSPSSSR